MGKKSLRKAKALAAKNKANGVVTEQPYYPPRVSRPFAEHPNEIELVAMRELIPCATLQLRTNAEYGNKKFMVATVAPNFSAGAVREDGMIIIAAAAHSRTNDAAHDLGVVLNQLLDAEPGTVLEKVNLNQPGPRLMDMVNGKSGTFTLYRDVEYWFANPEDITSEQRQALQQMREEVFHTVSIPGVRNAYWCEAKGPQYIRYFLPDWEEDELFTALARARDDGKLDWDNGHLIGVFRGLGMLVPVWELETPLDPEEPDLVQLGKDLAKVGRYLKKIRGSEERLSVNARGIRQGIISRSVVLN